MIWKTRRRTLDLTHQGVVMGILNATPDSFSDGGRHNHGESALIHALQMIDDGAQIIDIGGESTRPGAEEIDADVEINRTAPLIRALREKSDVLISIDTSKSSVADAAIEAGADIVNDVTGLRKDPAMAHLCAETGVGVCVMHMLGDPRTMQKNPDYGQKGVVATVQEFFKERVQTLKALGIDPRCICLDPGIGFGKTLEQNLQLLQSLNEFQKQHPVLLGVSRKSFIGTLTGETKPENRDAATAAITALTSQSGIRLHRVHNVPANVQALRVAAAFTPS